MDTYRSMHSRCLAAIALSLFLSQNGTAQISGRVIFNPDRERNGLSGVVVRGYGAAAPEKEELIAESVTDDQGHYFLDIPAGKRARIVFDYKGSDLVSSARTPSARYIQSPASDLNWVVEESGPGLTSLPIHAVAPVYIKGKGNDSTYSLIAVALSEPETRRNLASSGLTGALWGVAYDRRKEHIYSAAFAKRHAGYGMLGTGGIYRTDWNSGKTIPYIDLQAMGIQTGPDRHQGLTGDEQSKSQDSLLMHDVGRVSLGGIDMGADGFLYVVNLYDRSLYRIRIPSDSTQRPGPADIERFPVPADACKGGDCRPFAVKAYQGRLYIGATCDAAISGKSSDLGAVVYQLEPENKSFKKVFSIPLDYSRESGTGKLHNYRWNAWTDDFGKALHSDYPSLAFNPQPILSSIEFDSDGSMILGFMDRFGHQSGVGQPDPSGKIAVSGIAAGDLVRVASQGSGSLSGRHYKLESNAAAGKLATSGRGNMQGPSGGEFYFEDGFYEKEPGETRRVVHEETGNGGLVLLRSTGEVLSGAHEPGTTFNTGGIRSYYLTNGRYSRSWNLFENAQAGTFGKANGIGGIEIIESGAGISLGSRVWLDVNENGFQDIDEPGLGNIPVELWKDGRQLAITISDQDGIYGFGSDNVPSGIDAGTEYRVKINTRQLGMSVAKAGSGSPDRDNDAVTAGDYAEIQLKTGSSALETERFLDFGLTASLINKDKASREDMQLLVYPNPAGDVARIKFKAGGNNVVLNIYEAGGKIVDSRQLSGQSGDYDLSINVSHWTSGNYIVRIQEKDSLKFLSAILSKQ